MRRARTAGGDIAAVLIGAALLAGCGQKGPLTLPKSAPAASAPAASSPH